MTCFWLFFEPIVDVPKRGRRSRQTVSGRKANFGATSATMSKEAQEGIIVVAGGLLLLLVLLLVANHFRPH